MMFVPQNAKRRRAVLSVFAVMAAVTVAACTMNVPERPRPQFAYTQYPPTVLNVAEINVVEAYAPPMRLPNVEHLMPEPLTQSVATWARNRFRAGGADGVVTITVSDASVTAKDLSRTQGVKGWFTVDQAERFDARVLVEMQVDGVALGSTGSGTVRVERGQTVAENASVQDRDRVWTRMSESILLDLDAGTQQMLQNRLPFLLQN